VSPIRILLSVLRARRRPSGEMAGAFCHRESGGEMRILLSLLRARRRPSGEMAGAFCHRESGGEMRILPSTTPPHGCLRAAAGSSRTARPGMGQRDREAGQVARPGRTAAVALGWLPGSERLVAWGAAVG